MTDWAEKFDALPRLHGEPLATVKIRQQNSDFKVFEIPPCEPDGAGEHIWVHVRKNGCNTDWVAEQLARLAGVKPRDVSYAGRKDRHAICEQWFSVHLPGLETPTLQSDSNEFEVLSQKRHSRKLKTGALKGNRFEICMRPVSGKLNVDVVAERVTLIAEQGVPNYFGEQRFGRAMSNLKQVERWVAGGSLPRSKNRRSMTISAARSWLFNLILAGRLRKNPTDLLVKGDYCVISGRHSGFHVDEVTERHLTELSEGAIQISAPLIGEKVLADQWESHIDVAQESYAPQWVQRLGTIRLSTDWRPIRVIPREIQVKYNNDGSIEINFELSPGTFATSVIREIANLTD